MRVTGERIAFDFAGTDAQATGYINTPRAVTISSVMIAFFMIAEGEIPHNDGVLRRIEVLTPSGTLVNPEFPAPTCFGNHVADQLAAVIMLALAPAVPGRVTAGWNALLASTVNGTDPRSGRPYVDILLNACKGGGGGTEGADGFDHIGLIGSGGAIAAQDPEMFELVNPHLLHRYEYMPDSAGAGKWRGGLGVSPNSSSSTRAPRRASSATATCRAPRRSASSAAAPARSTRSTSPTPTATCTVPT